MQTKSGYLPGSSRCTLYGAATLPVFRKIFTTSGFSTARFSMIVIQAVLSYTLFPTNPSASPPG